MAAFDPPVIFGLAVKNNLSDIKNKDQALLNLGLQPNDLSIFGGIHKIATNDSFQALSNSEEELDLALTRLVRDSNFYQSAISEGTDIDNIQGNFTINGILAASAIRYYTLDFYDETLDAFQPIDISTSRVSSWSDSFDNNKIIYGGELKITKDSAVSAGSIKFGTAAVEVDFPYSEVATHVIKLSSNNKVYSVYAMKDIPITINGYFASASITCHVNTSVPGSYVTFKCYRPDYPLEQPEIRKPFLNVPPIRTRTLFINKPVARNRTIEIYTSPAAIERLNLQKIGADSFTGTLLPELLLLDLRENNFSTLPATLYKSTPKLLGFYISGNPLYKGSSTLTRDLSSKLPPTLQVLYIGNAYNLVETFESDGEQKSVFELFGLRELDITGGATKLRGTFPTVSGSCEIYSASNNDFTVLPERGLLRPQAENKLRKINLSSNPRLALTTGTSAIFLGNTNFSSNLEELSLAVTNLPIPDMRSAANLRTFSIGNNSINAYTGSLLPLRDEFNLHTAGGSYKFNNCNKLETIYIRYGDLFGELPIFRNSTLRSLTLGTSLSGVKKPEGAAEDYTLYTGTFVNCKNTLEILHFTTSNQSFPELPLETGSLDLPKLRELTWQTMGFNRTTFERSPGGTTGTTPSFENNTSLTKLTLFGNRFDNIGTISASLNNSLTFIDMGANFLDKTNGTAGLNFGQMFSVQFNKLQTIILQHNMFSSITNIVNVPDLQTLDVSYNALTGNIPNFSNAPKLTNLNLSNNRFTGFTRGAFDNLARIRSINLSNNINAGDKTLPLVSIEGIIQSIFTMFSRSSSNRGVYVDLRSGSNYTLTTSTAIAQFKYLTNARGPNFTILGISIPEEET